MSSLSRYSINQMAISKEPIIKLSEITTTLASVYRFQLLLSVSFAFFSLSFVSDWKNSPTYSLEHITIAYASTA